MPFTGEEKKKYNDAYRLKQKEKREKAKLLLQELKARDDAGDYAPGEHNTWVELLKIYCGLDPKQDSDTLEPSAKDDPRVNPSDHKFGEAVLSFEEWLDQRRKHKEDLWLLIHTLRGKWDERVHRPIVDFFVKKDPTTLPFDYNEDDKNQWLLSLDATRDEKGRMVPGSHSRLLLYPRASRKSTISLIDIAQWILCCPDIVALVVTATKKLAKDFIKALRSYFEIRDPRFPTKFQILFPDYCVPEGKGKTSGDVREYRCPKRRLFLVNPTVSMSSMESGTAGVRADVIRFDDSVDEVNCIAVDSRIKIREKFDAILELLVPPFGFWEAVGTRYTGGKIADSEEGPIPDLYGTILERSDEKIITDLKLAWAAAWTVKEEFREVPIKQLEESMVTLLGHAPFSSLIQKCRSNVELFRCQQLNEPALDTDKDDTFVNTFTEDNIWAKVVGTEWVNQVQGSTYLFVDTAMTAGRRSDYSAFAVARIQLRDEKGLPPLIWFLEIRADRYTDQKVAETIAELMAKWNCGAYVEDIPTTGVVFKNEVTRQIRIRGAEHLPLMWFVPSQEPKAKETRIRGLQILHDMGLLRFIRGTWMELVIRQLIGYRGHTAKGHKGRKDDIPDVMAYVQKVLPYIEGFNTEEQKKLEEERERVKERQRQYDRIYNQGKPLSTILRPEDDRPRDPIHDALRPLVRNPDAPTISFPRRQWNS